MKFQPKNINGQRFGKLVAVFPSGVKDNKGCHKWVCKCDCGEFVAVSIDNLRENGGTRSCGCERRATVTMQEYEERKKTELSDLTDDWEYVRCYDRQRGKHIVRCVHCGYEKTVAGIRNISECLSCARAKKKRMEEQNKYKECVVCGDVFKQYNPQHTMCSACHSDREREKRRTQKRLREARATQNGKVDYSITLAKLIERDNHICKLCGREVNESDYVYVGDTFIAGNDYPSIDHIKPLSKGGVHQWDNVQLAHRLCNSIKNNRE